MVELKWMTFAGRGGLDGFIFPRSHWKQCRGITEMKSGQTRHRKVAVDSSMY